MMDDLNEGGLGDLLDMQWLQITFHHGNPYDGDGDDDDDEEDNDNSIKNIAKGTTDARHWVLWAIQHLKFKAMVSFNKLQLGFVWQRVVDT